MAEVWAAIPDWEGLYSVSSHGRIRSEPRNVYRSTIARGYTVRMQLDGHQLEALRQAAVNKAPFTVTIGYKGFEHTLRQKTPFTEGGLVSRTKFRRHTFLSASPRN